MKKIDILLTYWGDFGLFKQTVESILVQTNPNWRLLIFDDCYPSLEAKNYIDTIQDKRVSYYRHTNNIGITNNFNFAVKRARSDFCSLIGCDDVLLPNYVDSALKSIGNADFYQPGVKVIDEHGKIYLPLVDRVKNFLRPKRPGLYSGENLAVSLVNGNWLYFPSIVWKTTVIRKYPFDPKYKIAQDVLVELSLVKDGYSLYLDNSVSFHYRRFANSLSSKERGRSGIRFKEENEVYDSLARKFSSMKWIRAAKAAKFRPILRIYHLVSR